MASGRLTPSIAMQNQLTRIDGRIHPVTLLGRWIARAQGADGEELERELRQRTLQEQRAGLYSSGGDRDSDGLLDYRQLYALWERQNWKATELDFSVDKEQWVITPREAQESTIWSLGSFYVGEQRVTADLAPFLQAAPTGEIELFLATQLVDEARHAAFFDRFGAEVMCLSAEDFRGRMREVEQILLSPWREVFDDGLRDVAKRIQAKPDDLDLFVEGITTYHMVVEGFLAVTGQTLIRDYMIEHSMYPGFCEGFGLVERDEHRHVAFGVRFLRDAIREDARHRATVERVVLELAPKAAYVFAPPYVTDASDYVSYGYTSRQIYGFAYRTLKRRMKVLGIEIPPAEEFMPGPIDGTTEFAAVPAQPGADGARASSNGQRRTAQAIARRRPRARRPERGARQQQAEADHRERQHLEARARERAGPVRGEVDDRADAVLRNLIAVGRRAVGLLLAARRGRPLRLLLRGHGVRHRLFLNGRGRGRDGRLGRRRRGGGSGGTAGTVVREGGRGSEQACGQNGACQEAPGDHLGALFAAGAPDPA